MRYYKYLLCGLSLCLFLSACQSAARQPEVAAATEAPTTQQTTQTTLPQSQFWDDVVELVNMAGDTTTVYKLADGRYLDRMDRFFTYDGVETWTCDDGSIWNRKAESIEPATHVSAEFAIERFLAQRPDHLFFSDSQGSEYASKVVLSFDTPVTNFRFLQLEGNFNQAGEFVCTNLQQLYSRDEMTENDLMVVETVLEGLIPTRGISFVDAGGNTQYYYLTISGEDNVPLLVAFQ